jgi:hypothetical protein
MENEIKLNNSKLFASLEDKPQQMDQNHNTKEIIQAKKRLEFKCKT